MDAMPRFDCTDSAEGLVMKHAALLQQVQKVFLAVPLHIKDYKIVADICSSRLPLSLLHIGVAESKGVGLCYKLKDSVHSSATATC